MHQSAMFFGSSRHPTAMPTDSVPRPSVPTVFVASRDTSTREALVAVARVEGWRTKELLSAKAFMSEPECTGPSCLVLDISLPWYGDAQFYESLAAERAGTSIVCVTGDADVLMTVRVMKAGAIDVLPKPLRADLLLVAIRYAVERSEMRLRESMALRCLRESYASLSPRERQVMTLVASGLLNKQVSGKLGISEITVKAHRGQAMRKMNARSFADLVKMADRLAATKPNTAC
jgi:FixJ family two-component response regulator